MTETEIIKGCIKKDQVCQRLLFEKYAGIMMSLCQRYATDEQESKDMMQEGFIRAFKHIEQFKFEGSFEGWLRRVFTSVAVRMLSQKKILFAEIEMIDSDATAINPSVLSKLSEDEIHKAINRLPQGYRLVFNLYVVEGHSHQEIGNMLGIEASTSRTQLTKARRFLQAIISKKFNTVIL